MLCLCSSVQRFTDEGTPLKVSSRENLAKQRQCHATVEPHIGKANHVEALLLSTDF